MTAARAALITFLFLSACGEPANLPKAENSEPSANRIVTLAPHLAEMIFEVGAGERLVGVSAYTDYPAEAANIQIVGDAFAIDREGIANNLNIRRLGRVVRISANADQALTCADLKNHFREMRGQRDDTVRRGFAILSLGEIGRLSAGGEKQKCN